LQAVNFEDSNVAAVLRLKSVFHNFCDGTEENHNISV